MLTTEQAFQLLELQPSATWEEVRQAYRELVKVWHPDRFQDDEKFKIRATRKVQDINAAYQVLEAHYQKPPAPPPPIPKPDKAEEMFERWAADSKIRSQFEYTPEASLPLYFSNLTNLLLYASFDQPYRVYPCHVDRSPGIKWTVNKIAGAIFVTGIGFAGLSLFKPTAIYFAFVCFFILVVVKLMDWAASILGTNIPDALQITSYGVTVIEDIHLKNGAYSATKCKFFTYEQICNVKWNDREITFQTTGGLKFTFKPSRPSATIQPDTRHFKVDVYSMAQVIAHFQNR